MLFIGITHYVLWGWYFKRPYAWLSLAELSTVFLNMRWFLATAGMKDSSLYIANGVAMFLSFLILRVSFNIWLCIVRFGVQHEEFSALPFWLQVRT